MLNWMVDHWVVVAGAVAGIWVLIQHITASRAADRRHRFDTYHRLIKDLVEGDGPNGEVRMHRQVATLYELSSYKAYAPVTVRILKDLYAVPAWRNSPLVAAEIELTLRKLGA